MPHLLVFGARNLGRVIGEHFLAQGRDATGVARTQETADAFPGAGIVADATSAQSIRGVVEHVAPFDLVVNAVSQGPLRRRRSRTTDDDAMAPYLEQALPTAFAFFRVCGGALIERGGGTIVQVTGGSARRALPGRAPWGAGAAGQRALSQAAANELKPHGVHAALLVCDGTFGGPGDDAAASGSTPASSRRPSSSCTSRGGARGRTSWS